MRAIFAAPHPDGQAQDAHLLPATPFSPGRKEMGADGDGLRRHLQTWMAKLNPNCIRATRGAGQDLPSESSGKGFCPEPSWTRENAKPLRTATLPDGAKWPRRAPNCLRSRRGGGMSLAHWWRLGLSLQHPIAGPRETVRDNPAAERRPRRRPRLRRPYLGPSPNTEDRSSPALRPVARSRGTQGTLRKVFSVTLFSAR